MSYPPCHTQHVIPSMSYPACHTQHVIPTMSHPAYHTKHVIPSMSHPARHCAICWQHSWVCQLLTDTTRCLSHSGVCVQCYSCCCYYVRQHIYSFTSRKWAWFGRYGEISPFVGFGPQTTLGGKWTATNAASTLKISGPWVKPLGENSILARFFVCS